MLFISSEKAPLVAVLDMDEDMMMTRMSMFENEFKKIVQDIMKNRF